MAACQRPAAARGSVPFHSPGPRRVELAAVSDLCRPRIPGCRGLHGSGQLGDIARRWQPVRLCPAVRCAALEPDGHPAAGALRAARHRLRAGPGTGLPGCLSELGEPAPLGAGGSCDHCHGPCRSDRHGDRAQPAISHPARDRHPDHGPRCVFDPVSAEQGVPLGRGVHHHPARGHRPVFSDADCARQS